MFESSIAFGIALTIAWTAYCLHRWFTREWLTHHCLHSMFAPQDEPKKWKNRCCLCLGKWPIKRRPSYECKGSPLCSTR